MIVNVVVNLARKRNRECLILKVDFEKAYDFDQSLLQIIHTLTNKIARKPYYFLVTYLENIS